MYMNEGAKFEHLKSTKYSYSRRRIPTCDMVEVEKWKAKRNDAVRENEWAFEESRECPAKDFRFQVGESQVRC